MQQLVTDIRSAGYTNPLIFNKWNQPWIIIKDSLNMTFQGYHFYFNSWSVKGALDQMATALKKGIKLICTEVGGDYREYKYFTADTVKKLGDYLSEARKIGVGGIVWLNRLYESKNINTYRQ
ncbi:MAG: hypothetical protein QG670_2108, partial [Thermoproteota archaeon]|nr:hypothetical protein [Thermoproteota archaeon]